MSGTIKLEDGHVVTAFEVAATALVLKRLNEKQLLSAFLFAHLSIPLPLGHKEVLQEAKLIEPDGTMREDTSHITKALLANDDPLKPLAVKDLGQLAL